MRLALMAIMALMQLNERTRDIFVLHRLEQLTYSAVAETLGTFHERRRETPKQSAYRLARGSLGYRDGGAARLDFQAVAIRCFRYRRINTTRARYGGDTSDSIASRGFPVVHESCRAE